jgi:hypothetical protein
VQAWGLQAPARAQRPTRNTRIKRRNFRADFVGYFDVPESKSKSEQVDTLYLRIFGLRRMLMLVSSFVF